MSKNDISIFHSLITEPKKSLESKLQELEKQKKTREELNDFFLSELLTKKLHFKQLHHNQRYQPNDIQRQIIQIESNIQNEKLSCFHDVAEISAKIHTINEEIALHSIKQSMLQDE